MRNRRCTLFYVNLFYSLNELIEKNVDDPNGNRGLYIENIPCASIMDLV